MPHTPASGAIASFVRKPESLPLWRFYRLALAHGSGLSRVGRKILSTAAPPSRQGPEMTLGRVALTALCGALRWLYSRPGFDSTVFGLLVRLHGTFARQSDVHLALAARPPLYLSD